MENSNVKIADLLLKYKTDKNHGTIKNIYENLDTWEITDNPESPIGHTYGVSYDEIFENYGRESKINILEIGIQKGGSLLAWKDYFTNGNIYGVDIVDVILPEYKRNDFNYIISDIKSPHVIEQLKGVSFDIIIDDGSHYIPDVLFVVSNFLTKLNPGGVLIVEDCQAPESWLQQIESIVPGGFIVTTKDLRGEGAYDNYLIIITKIGGWNNIILKY
jgi:SAM-dependent methyltransferase